MHRLVQGLLSVEKWQSDCEMLQCAADDYASTRHEADRWCRLGRDRASSLGPLGARGIIYNVPLDIFTDHLVACLASQGVRFVKRFRFKSSDSSELMDSKSVFLQFTTADLPSEVKLRYLFFRVKQCVPRPLRWFKYNRYGHVAGHCRGKMRCSICGGEHKYSECSAAAPKCPNCKL